MTSQVIAARGAAVYKPGMRHVVTASLLLVSLIHLLPVLGVLGAARLGQLYGIAVAEPNLEILLRHRAVLFGIVALVLGWAAFRPALQPLAFAVGLLSVASFLALAGQLSGANAQLLTVVRVDWLALVLSGRGWAGE